MKSNPASKWILILGAIALATFFIVTAPPENEAPRSPASIPNFPGQSAAKRRSPQSLPAAIPTPAAASSANTAGALIAELKASAKSDLQGHKDFIEILDVEIKRNGEHVERESLYRSSGPFAMIRVRHFAGPTLASGKKLIEENAVVGNRLIIDLKERSDFETIERLLQSENLAFTLIRRMVTSPRVVLDFQIHSLKELDRAAALLEADDHVAAIHFDPVFQVAK